RDPHDGFHRRYISGGAEMLVGNLCVNGEPSRFETMPSRPILQAWRKTNSPSLESGRLAPPAPSAGCVPMPRPQFSRPWPIPVGVSTVAEVTTCLFPITATPICPQAAAISDARYSRNGIYGISVEADHSGLMLASRTTLAHFSVSSAMSLPKSAGEP